MPEQAGASWARLGQVGASWDRLGQVGAGWGKFKLAQCSHCFFLSPLCFVHYLCKWNKLCESLRCPK